MPEPGINFRAILRLLIEAEVRFVIIGGVALHLHGADNLTLDMDISFARDTANTDALAKILNSLHARYRDFPPDLPCLIDGQTLRNSTNLTLKTDLGEFDLLAEPEGADSFQGLWERATTMLIESMEIHVASIDDLIAMKKAANREKDRLHIMQLEALKKIIASGSDPG